MITYADIWRTKNGKFDPVSVIDELIAEYGLHLSHAMVCVVFGMDKGIPRAVFGSARRKNSS